MSLTKSPRPGRAAASLGREVCPARRVDSVPASKAAPDLVDLRAAVLEAHLEGRVDFQDSRAASGAALARVDLLAQAGCRAVVVLAARPEGRVDFLDSSRVAQAARLDPVDCRAAAVLEALEARQEDPVGFPDSSRVAQAVRLDLADYQVAAALVVLAARPEDPVGYQVSSRVVQAVRLDPVDCRAAVALAARPEDPVGFPDNKVDPAVAALVARLDPADYPVAAAPVGLAARLGGPVGFPDNKVDPAVAVLAVRLDLVDYQVAAAPVVDCPDRALRPGRVDCQVSKAAPEAGHDRVGCPDRVLRPGRVDCRAVSQADLDQADCQAAVAPVGLAARPEDRVGYQVSRAVRAAARAPARCPGQSAARPRGALVLDLSAEPPRPALLARWEDGLARPHHGPAPAPARPRGGAASRRAAEPKRRKLSRSYRSIPSSISWGSCASSLRWSRSLAISRAHPVC